MSREFKIIIKNEDLHEADIFMAIENYADELLKYGEIEETLEFDVITMDEYKI